MAYQKCLIFQRLVQKLWLCLGLALVGCQSGVVVAPTEVRVSPTPPVVSTSVAIAPVAPTATRTTIATPTLDAEAILFATLTAATAIPTPSPVAPFTSGNVDIGGYSLFLSCEGSGSPTVVLDHGAGGAAGDWRAVQDEVSAFTRVCSYTRAPSGIGAHPHTLQTSVDDLQKLLAHANVEPPFIMVGFSWGGYVSRVYADQHRQDLEGLVLVDARADTPESEQVLEDYVAAAAKRGEPWAVSYEEELAPLRDPDTTWEGMDLTTSVQQAAAVTSLGNLPVVVLTARLPVTLPNWSPGFTDLVAQNHDMRQHDLLKLSTRSVQIFAEHSSHNIPGEAPEMVIQAIRTVLDMGTN